MNSILYNLLYKLKILSIVISKRKMQIGKNVKIDIRTKIYCSQNTLIIGDNVYLRSKRKGYHAGMPFPTTILLDGDNCICQIDSNCRINGCYIHAKKKIIIGKNTVIASGTNIIDSNGHITRSKNRTVGKDDPEPIIIGENVWIGLNCLILKGTEIGSNCVISAGSIVKGKYPANCIISGNPATITKRLNAL